MKTYEALCPIADLPTGKPRLVRLGDRRLAAVRLPGDRVHVVDDRCPHEGHPLSMGLVHSDPDGGGLGGCEAVLTCPWHNWKFDLATGDCLFGGESVLRYPTWVHDETVFVDVRVDGTTQRARTERDLERAVREGLIDGAVRESLRLQALTGDAESPFTPLARLLGEHGPFGLGDGVLAVAATLRLLRRGFLRPAEAYAAAAAAVGEDVRARSARPRPSPLSSTLEGDLRPFLADLVEERRVDAVARVLGLPAAQLPAVTAAWFLPFASLKLWDRGLVLPRLVAAQALAAAAPDATLPLALGAAGTLAWAVAESDLPGFRPTRVALQEVTRLPLGEAPLTAGEGSALVDEVLRGERPATEATLAALRAHGPRPLVDPLVRATLLRAARYDVAWSSRVGSDVDAFEAGRAVLLAAAILELAATPEGLRFLPSQLTQLAGLVGRLSRVSSPAAAHATAGPPLEARAAALPFGAPGKIARPLAVAEALARLAAHGFAEAEAAYTRLLDDERAPGLARIVANAEKFLADGRPPEGLL